MVWVLSDVTFLFLGQVIAMLIDIHKFWAYDNRESLGTGNDSNVDDEAEDVNIASGGSFTGSTVGGSATLSPSLQALSESRVSFHRSLDNSYDDDPYDF